MGIEETHMPLHGARQVAFISVDLFQGCARRGIAADVFTFSPDKDTGPVAYEDHRVIYNKQLFEIASTPFSLKALKRFKLIKDDYDIINYKLNRISRQMLQEMGREPTPEELAERMLMPEDKIRKVLKIAKEPISMETPIGDDEDSHLGDFIEDTTLELPLDSFANHAVEELDKVLLPLQAGSEVLLPLIGLPCSVAHLPLRKQAAKLQTVRSSERVQPPHGRKYRYPP